MHAQSLEAHRFWCCGFNIKSYNPLLKEHVYSFKTKRKKAYYTVRVEEYDHDMFVLKFHLKSHKLSNLKYVILTGLKDDPRKIIYTCISIGNHILSKNKNASFGFIGSPTLKELEREQRLSKTKRFRIYKNFAYTFFSPDNFVHNYDPSHSSYILLNKNKLSSCPDLLDKIQTSLESQYDIEEMFANLITH